MTSKSEQFVPTQAVRAAGEQLPLLSEDVLDLQRERHMDLLHETAVRSELPEDESMAPELYDSRLHDLVHGLAQAAGVKPHLN